MSTTLAYADRVMQTTMTTGEGPFALLTPPPGYRSVSATIGVGVPFRCVVDLPGSDEFVLCQATVDSSDLLTLGAILQSSNGGASVAFPDGEKRVMVVLAAEDIPALATDGSLDLSGRVSAAEGGYFQGANPQAAGLWTELGTASGGGFLRAITRGTNVLASMLYDAASHAWHAATVAVMQLSSTALNVGIGVAGFALIVGSADPGGSQALRIGGTMHASGAATFDSTASFGGQISQTSASAAEMSLFATSVGTATLRYSTNSSLRWTAYIPSGSSDYRLANAGAADMFTLTQTGTATHVGLVSVQGGSAAPSAGQSQVQLWNDGNPKITFVSSTNTANARLAEFIQLSNGFRGRFINDGYNSAVDWIEVVGTSASVASVTFPGSAVVVGADPGGSQLLRVGGAAIISGLTQFGGNIRLQTGTTASIGTFDTQNFQILTNNALSMQFDNSNNAGFFSAPSVGGGTLVIFVANRSVAPTSNPVGGGILYAEAGALKWRGSGGTVTTVANA